MKTVTRCVCDRCNEPIDPDLGFIIHGNVYKIKENLTERAGVIGNMFPTPVDNKIDIDDVKEQSYHIHCLDIILRDSIALTENLKN